MMKHNIIAAIVLAIGLIAAALIYTGRYYAVRLDAETIARMDRWTGDFTVCSFHGQLIACSNGGWLNGAIGAPPTFTDEQMQWLVKQGIAVEDTKTSNAH
jgi:hypothetical protein